MSAPAAQLQAAAHAGLRFVIGQLGSSGQWPSRRHARADCSDDGRHETSACVTALGVLALAGVDDPLAAIIRRRSERHLAGTMRPPGLWRYYRDLPYDVDTSSIAALALRLAQPLRAERAHVPSLLAGRTPDGRFRIWLTGAEPIPEEIDAIVNTNAVAVLGERPETEPAVRWIAEVVDDQRAREASWYYRDELDLALAVQRAVESGVAALEPCAATLADRAATRLAGEAETLPAHRLAQAIVAAAWRGPRSGDAALAAVRSVLAARQRADGSWPGGALYVGPRPPGPPTSWFSSGAVTTALCVRALAAGRPRPRSVERPSLLL